MKLIKMKHNTYMIMQDLFSGMFVLWVTTGTEMYKLREFATLDEAQKFAKTQYN